MKQTTLAFLVVLASVGLMACSSSPSQSGSSSTGSDAVAGSASSNSNNDIVCTRHKPVGSNMTKKVCTTRAQSDEEARKTQEALRGQSAGRGSSRGGDG